MRNASAFLLAAIVLSTACGTTATPTSFVEPEQPPSPLPCAGQVREDSVAIPELGPLPSGDPVTAGLALTCAAQSLKIVRWSPDSVAVDIVPRERAMEVWAAWSRGTTADERWLEITQALAGP